MCLPHCGIELVPQAQIKRQPRCSAPIILTVESIGVVIEMAPLNSALNRSEFESGLILKETDEAARKIYATSIKDGLSNDEIDAIEQDAEFQRMFSLRIKG